MSRPQLHIVPGSSEARRLKTHLHLRVAAHRARVREEQRDADRRYLAALDRESFWWSIAILVLVACFCQVVAMVWSGR